MTTIDLTPDNEQIAAANMSLYTGHADWPFESLRTITERTSAEGVDPATYGCPIEKNIALYRNDVDGGLIAEIDESTFEIWMPPHYVEEGRSSTHAVRICSIMHSKKTQNFLEFLLSEEMIKTPPQYQYYRCNPDDESMIDVLLKFENKEDAAVWNATYSTYATEE